MSRDNDRWNDLVFVEDPRAIAFLAALLMLSRDQFDVGFGMGLASHVHTIAPAPYPGLPRLLRREFRD